MCTRCGFNAVHSKMLYEDHVKVNRSITLRDRVINIGRRESNKWQNALRVDDVTYLLSHFEIIQAFYNVLNYI